MRRVGPSVSVVADFLHRLYAAQSVPSLVTTICEGLTDIVDGDNVAVARCHADTRSLTAACCARPFSHARFMPDIMLTGLLTTHPFWDHVLKPDRPVKALSDFIGERRWKSHPYYCAFLREDGFQDHMGVETRVSGKSYTNIDVLRTRRGYTDAERHAMLMLKPHFEQAFYHAQIAETYLSGDGDERCRGASVLRVRSDGALAEVMRQSGQENPVPVAVQNWVKKQVAWLNRGVMDQAIKPFILQDDHRRIEFRLCRQWGEPGYLLSFRSLRNLPPKKKLSPRERDVMRWVGAGKTNDEIAIILGASPHTVKDHLKSIYRKLGVDNRTAASRVWLARSVYTPH